MNVGIPNINDTKQLNLFPKSIQKKINWFAFFLAFPAINILSNSITFYLFIAIIYQTGPFWKKDFKGRILFFLFILIVIISTIFAPYQKLVEHPGFLKSFQMTIQYSYWILIATFFITKRNKINITEVSKWLFFGTVMTILGYYIFPIKIGSDFLGISFTQARNFYVFILFCTVPLCFIYIKKKYSRNIQIAFLFFFLAAWLLSNGRSGAVIGIIEILLISILLFPIFAKSLRFMLIPFICLYVLFQNQDVQVYLDSVANKVEQVSPRFASLLRSEGEGDLTQDKSWLIRKLMIDKGVSIVREYPFFGIGPGNFKYYGDELKTLRKYKRLSNYDESHYNKKSAHNSYIQLITDFGIIGFSIFILIILFPLLYFLKLLIRNKLTFYHVSLISLIGICIHFYAVSAITGAIPWLIIGLSWSSMKNISEKQI